MLPQVNDDLINDFEEVVEPSKTLKLDLTNKRITGLIDGREAIEQFIYKTLNTKRYDYVIYSWNYGSELTNLFGKPIPLVYSEIKRYITEALIQDERILNVDNFSFSNNKKRVAVSFTAHTIFGEVDFSQEVPF